MNCFDFQILDKDKCDIKIVIPPGVYRVEELWELYKKNLDFPYFGDNWSAFADLLQDLSWLQRKRVLIVHEAMPDIGPDTSMYLDILEYCVKGWVNNGRRLRASFPPAYRNEIEILLCKVRGDRI